MQLGATNISLREAATNIDTKAVFAETQSCPEITSTPSELYVESEAIASRLGFSYNVVKRILDIILTLALLPFVLSPALFFCALICIDSRGSVFFEHSRIKRFGHSFAMWKIRTMCLNGAEVLEMHFKHHPADRIEWEVQRKLKEDPRVGRLGNFLRRTSLDELPQLWNVLVGDMSLVGPRPIVFEELERYNRDATYYLAVKPGITGLWQVSGRSKLSFEERIKIDRYYVENWSIWMDCVILIRSFWAVLSFDGAY